jgi:hypothetical protein
MQFGQSCAIVAAPKFALRDYKPMPHQLKKLPKPVPSKAEWHHLHCSFCGKNAVRARMMVAGAKGGRICDDCCLKSAGMVLKARISSAIKK